MLGVHNRVDWAVLALLLTQSPDFLTEKAYRTSFSVLLAAFEAGWQKISELLPSDIPDHCGCLVSFSLAGTLQKVSFFISYG